MCYLMHAHLPYFHWFPRKKDLHLSAYLCAVCTDTDHDLMFHEIQFKPPP